MLQRLRAASGDGRRRGSPRPFAACPTFEALEPRTLFAAAVLDAGTPSFTSEDADHDRVTVRNREVDGRSISAGSSADVLRLPRSGNRSDGGQAAATLSPLTAVEVQDVIERAVARATQLDVNATIALSDREGNLLAVVRMTNPDLTSPAARTVDIKARGRGGLEAVDRIVPTSLIAATKAGTAAFLSSDSGNAFTTRTAGQIIQTHFPPGIDQRVGGPLFGVQLSSLPTSDVNRLPLGLSADPGGLPLYRMGRRGGELLGGIGVEVDGDYKADPTGVGGGATMEEMIALAGQVGLRPRARMLAARVFVDGIRLDYANAAPPKLASLGPLPDYATLASRFMIHELLAPRSTPAGPTGRQSKFAPTTLAAPRGRDIPGEVPDGSQAPGGLGLDFFDEVSGTPTFLDGDLSGAERLTSADIETILSQAHALNHRLRAQIRTDQPQRSQVSVAVVDLNGNVLGVFRTPDAPMFGYDVAVQKARSAAFMSRADAGAELSALDSEINVALIEDMFPEILATTDPYARHVAAASNIGIELDGSVALADRSIGFLARPNLPDGINGAPPGPFTALAPDSFSPFNTGLQTTLIVPQLVEFLLPFTVPGNEATALRAFANGASGGGGVVPLDSNAGGFNTAGLPGNSLANGLQIFAGSVPLYKNGVLVGAVGVSGDGIEQDDFVAFAGAGGHLSPQDPGFFQSFGPGVVRADRANVTNEIRLPYVKLPRSPFAGV